MKLPPNIEHPHPPPYYINHYNILQEETFKIVIQKNMNYQTGADKQIPVMCIADLADLTVTDNLIAA